MAAEIKLTEIQLRDKTNKEDFAEGSFINY